MIPYFELTHISLGPINLQAWGLFVSAGILLGAATAARMARKRGQDAQMVWDTATWAIIGAFVFARLTHVLAYEPEFFLAHPLDILKVWQGGFSVAGGFVGAALFGLFFLRKKGVDPLAYADTMIFGLPVGLFIGRIGCFLIHDHPGTATDFFLGVQYPDGVVRHDHGLYLSLNGLLLFLVFLLFPKKSPPFYLILFLIWYGLVRFFLDFLRATDGVIVDTRYWFLTPAQYVSLVMVASGVGLCILHLCQKKRRGELPR